MSHDAAQDLGPDLRVGVPEDRLKNGEMLRGHWGEDPVLLIRRGAVFHAIGALCSHYSGPLEQGLLTADTVHCPLHHACFDLASGRATRAPGLAPLTVYDVERHLNLIRVTGPQPFHGQPAHATAVRPARAAIGRVVILGTGAAGSAAAIALRDEGFDGEVVMIGAETAAPYDRPNLSKDYLAGTASEEWLPLRPLEAYAEQRIRLVLGTPATRIDPNDRTVSLQDGRAFRYDRLVIATGADPIRPPIPGIEGPQVRTLRSLGDCHALVQASARATSAVIIGAGFLGLEVAASLRQRGLAVHVAAPDQVPLGRILGPALGDRIRRLHEEHGVIFHLETAVSAIGADAVKLADGTSIPAGLVVVATGVRPNTALAGRAGLELDHGLVVDRYLETSVKGIYAAGDAARWPDPTTGELTGCGHWSLAGRMGQSAARNLLGLAEPFNAAPFFWSQHYDVRIDCTGNTDTVTRIEVRAGLSAGEWEQSHYRDERLVAVTTIGRGRQSLEAERSLESGAVRRAVPA